MVAKRGGDGGNASRDPRANAGAQQAYKDKFKRATKSCTGLLHHDGAEIDVVQFRQAKNNRATFLQSRCDLCNRLYFSIQQKPIKRVAAAIVFLSRSMSTGWEALVPGSLLAAVTAAIVHDKKHSCASQMCRIETQHGDYRSTATALSLQLSGIDRLERTSWIVDERTGERYPASLPMHDLQAWGGKSGRLWEQVPTSTIWEWWVNAFPDDTAFCSREERESAADPDFELVAHPLSDFPWGAGNVKDTIQGHSVPAFNQVRRSASVLSPSGNSSGRAYGFLCEGDHLEMLKSSQTFKAQGLSLGHSPAPLRWLGKNDPINARGEPLDENVQKRDSLAELHQIATQAPDEAGKYVSWQIRPLVVALGEAGVSREEFVQRIQASVEEYFDALADQLMRNIRTNALADLHRACPGLTDTVYQYRLSKLSEWLTGRPSYSASRPS